MKTVVADGKEATEGFQWEGTFTQKLKGEQQCFR